MLGVSEATVSNWERDVSKPKNRLGLVRRVLGMDEPEPASRTDVDAVLQSASDHDIWQEATRRFFGGRVDMYKPDRAARRRGELAELPDDMIDMQSGERGESDA